jgi:hypothetical protein
MATIQCNEISQTINELLIAFQDCNKIKNSDLRLLVELVAAVNSCANGGAHYDTLIQEVYEPVSDTIVSYPVNSFHSISIMVINGNITQQISSTIVTYPTGTVLNTEYTTLNQTSVVFTAKAGSTVVVEYLIENP